MQKLTKTQMEIIGLYLILLVVFVLLGILSSRKERGLGALIGLNIGVSIVSMLWLWKGHTAWKNTTQPPVKTQAPSK